MDQREYERQTDALLSAMEIAGRATPEAVKLVRDELVRLRTRITNLEGERSGLAAELHFRTVEADTAHARIRELTAAAPDNGSYDKRPGEQ